MTVDDARAVAQVLREITSSRPTVPDVRQATAASPDPTATPDDTAQGPELDRALLALITEEPFDEEAVLRKLVADALRD